MAMFPAATPPAAGGGTGGPNVGRRRIRKGLLTFTWRAQDENRDQLVYDVFYRREGETTVEAAEERADRRDRRLGHVIGPERPLRASRGRVRFAVQCSGDGARQGALESTAFDIDNTPPVITVTSVNRQRAGC
jgi:hypothetical protein